MGLNCFVDLERSGILLVFSVILFLECLFFSCLYSCNCTTLLHLSFYKSFPSFYSWFGVFFSVMVSNTPLKMLHILWVDEEISSCPLSLHKMLVCHGLESPAWYRIAIRLFLVCRTSCNTTYLIAAYVLLYKSG